VSAVASTIDNADIAGDDPGWTGAAFAATGYSGHGIFALSVSYGNVLMQLPA
jgi:hypothetical protein